MGPPFSSSEQVRSKVPGGPPPINERSPPCAPGPPAGARAGAQLLGRRPLRTRTTVAGPPPGDAASGPPPGDAASGPAPWPMPSAHPGRGSRFGGVIWARIVRGVLAQCERGLILSRRARTARGGVDSGELGSHFASRVRRAPVRFATAGPIPDSAPNRLSPGSCCPTGAGPRRRLRAARPGRRPRRTVRRPAPWFAPPGQDGSGRTGEAVPVGASGGPAAAVSPGPGLSSRPRVAPIPAVAVRARRRGGKRWPARIFRAAARCRASGKRRHCAILRWTDAG